MTSTTRTRSLPTSIGGATLEGSYYGFPWTTDPTPGYEINGKQVTVSEGHPFNPRKNNGLADLGGPFFTQKWYVELNNTRRSISGCDATGQACAHYEGPVFPVSPQENLWPQEIHSGNTSLDAYGATAIARCKPTNSVADASTFLGELLKDRIPDLVGSTFWKDRTSRAKSAGDEFLNVQFGWKPLVNDIRKFCGGVTNADAILKQYERDSGGVVRRRFDFPVLRSRTTEMYGSNGSVSLRTSANALLDPTDFGQAMVTEEKVTRRWFSGAFTYHLPSGYDSRDKMSRYALLADKVLGLHLTPEVVWNLSPWSWAVDWFSSTGDVISNLSDWSADGLVMRYGYMMEHTIVRRTYSRSNSGLKPRTYALPISFVIETKVRRKANPFGFGITFSGLSPVQVAIAAALGLSRS